MDPEPALKQQRREWPEDDAASRASWQSKSDYHPWRQGWLCYRCKESCGKDAKSCEKPIHTLKTSAIADIVDRIQYRAKCDLGSELQLGLEELERRGFRRPETAKEAVELRKSLHALEDGKIASVPHDLLLAPAEQEFESPGPQITEIGAALRDVEAPLGVPTSAGLGPEATPATPTTPEVASVDHIPLDVLRQMARVFLSYSLGPGA